MIGHIYDECSIRVFDYLSQSWWSRVGNMYIALMCVHSCYYCQKLYFSVHVCLCLLVCAKVCYCVYVLQCVLQQIPLDEYMYIIWLLSAPSVNNVMFEYAIVYCTV